MKSFMDLSQFNAVADWDAAAGNVAGVILRAGYRGYGPAGTLGKDARFASHLTGAGRAGIPAGVYFVSQAVTEAEAAEEADFTAELAGGYKISLPVFIDSEWSHPQHTGRADMLSAAQRTDCVLAFCARARALGYTPGVYASESWFGSMLQLKRLAGLKRWCAKYSPLRPVIACDFWQYTDSGSIPGIPGRVDLSREMSPDDDGRMRRDIAKTRGVTLSVTARSGLRLRAAPGDGRELEKMEMGSSAAWYGYYCVKDGVKWLYVRAADGRQGYASAEYLKEVTENG